MRELHKFIKTQDKCFEPEKKMKLGRNNDDAVYDFVTFLPQGNNKEKV